MKKFLSLVLALVMAMSLVTISAGATEYKDLTDKDEIQYEEAVAVLNRIGVITGYEDGSFKPEGELTRGAAAKIIVSLLIGPEAANNLPNNYAPYPDVPAGSTFAGVISYCKTKNIISGYGDGTFKPAGTLTGYAFAKMLLGAVGYDANLELFTGSGWTMNVASVGQSAGLFDRLRFDGSKAVNREEACQLALNALKATVVQYSQGINVNVTGADTNVVVSGGQTRSYKTSNQEFARNIRTRNYTEVASSDNYYTVEFAEEHFVDLRLEHDKWNPTNDDFGRPSAEWSYKKVTIGTYPLEPDFSFNTQVAHVEASDSAKVRALGLRGYELTNDADGDRTVLWLNGVETRTADNGTLPTVASIADYTDNGTVVEVYVDENDADHITDVVVIQTQLMEVKRVGSDYVSLDRIGQDNDGIQGFNQPAIDVRTIKNVNEDDDYYSVLSGLKAGDAVAVVPVSIEGNWEVGRAYVPETVTGKLSRVTTYGAVSRDDPEAVDLTVGGTVYKIANWNKDMHDLDADTIKVTTKDVTLILDEFGNALRAKDVGATSDYMVVGSIAQTLQNGRIVYLVEGWDGSGNAVSLNVGTADPTNLIGGLDVVPSDLVYYTNKDVSGSAEWRLVNDNSLQNDDGDEYGIYNIDLDAEVVSTPTPNTPAYKIKSSNVRVALTDNVGGTPGTADLTAYLARDVKFIYVDEETATINNVPVPQGTVDTIEFFTGAQNVEQSELRAIFAGAQYSGQYTTAQAYVNKDGYVEAVVMKGASNTAQTSSLMYIKDYDATQEYNSSNGSKYYGYIVAMLTNEGLEDEVHICSTRRLDRGDFATYTKATDENAPLPDAFYTLREYNSVGKTTSVLSGLGIARVISSGRADNKDSKDLMVLTNVPGTANISSEKVVLGVGDGTTSEQNMVRVPKNAYWIDVTRQNFDIGDLDDLWSNYTNQEIALVFNDNLDSDGFRTVSAVVVISATSTRNSAVTPEVPEAADMVTVPETATKVSDTEYQVNKEDSIVLDAGVPADAKYGQISYQWMRQAKNGDGTLKVDSNGDPVWERVPGATDATFEVPTSAAGTDVYYCQVTNVDNSKDDQKVTVITTEPVKFTVAATTADQDQAAAIEAKKATVTVNVTGTGADKAVVRVGTQVITENSNTVTAGAQESLDVTISAKGGAKLLTNTTIDPSTAATLLSAPDAKTLEVLTGVADADGKVPDVAINIEIVEDLDLTAVADNFQKAALADQKTDGAVSAEVLNAGYTMTSVVSGEEIDLTFTHPGEYHHKCGAGAETWVVGFYTQADEIGGWTLSSVSISNKAASNGGNGVNFGSTSDAYWLTFYQANSAKVDAITEATAMGNDGVTTGTVSFTQGSFTKTVTLNVDCSGVKLMPWNATPSAG